MKPGLKLLAAAAAALTVPVAPASADWILPSVRVDNQGEQAGSVTTGDIGTGGGRSVIFFAQGSEGGPILPFTVASPLGAPAWTPPTGLTLPDGTTAGSGYTVGVAPNGDALGVFLTGGKVYRFIWPSDGSPALDPTPVLDGIGGGSVRAAMTPDGALHVVAQKAAAPKPLVYVRLAPGGAPGTALTVAEKDAIEHDLAVSPAGVAVSYTRSPAGGPKKVVVRRLLASDTEFSAEAAGLVDMGGDPLDTSQVAMDGSGIATVTFRRSPPATGPIPNPSMTHYARWLAGSPEIGDPRNLSAPPDPPAPPQSGPQNQNPDVAVDGAGRVTFIWEERGGPGIVSRELVNGVLSAKQTISASGQRAALGVTPEGHAVIAFQDPPDQSAAIIAMERPTGNVWGARTTISREGADAGRAGFAGFPRLSVTATQADAFFLQEMGPDEDDRTNAGIAARNILPTEPPPETPVTDARGCPPNNPTQSGGDGNDQLVGTAGNDNLLGAGGNDGLAGLAGDDCIRGEDGNDDMGGDAGNDTVVGGPGDDFARGNEGDDIVTGGEGDDRLSGAQGVDRVEGEDGNDRMTAGDGDDAAFGGPGDDRIFLQSGNDLGLGGDGNDLVSGGNGNDIIFGDPGNDNLVDRGGRSNRLDGGEGNDRIRGGRGRDLMIGGPGLDRMFGYSNRDLIIGGDDADVISGNSGNDRLAGRDGDDRIRGGTGNDRITGGRGNDRIWADTGRDIVNSGSGDDIIHAAGGGADTIRCGLGNDLVSAGPEDRVARNCEIVKIRSARAAGAGDGGLPALW